MRPLGTSNISSSNTGSASTSGASSSGALISTSTVVPESQVSASEASNSLRHCRACGKGLSHHSDRCSYCHTPDTCPRCGVVVAVDALRCGPCELEFTWLPQYPRTPTPPPTGECIACDHRGRAGGSCPGCGAPIEPFDESCHYLFGWWAGPRAYHEHVGSLVGQWCDDDRDGAQRGAQEA